MRPRRFLHVAHLFFLGFEGEGLVRSNDVLASPALEVWDGEVNASAGSVPEGILMDGSIDVLDEELLTFFSTFNVSASGLSEVASEAMALATELSLITVVLRDLDFSKDVGILVDEELGDFLPELFVF